MYEISDNKVIIYVTKNIFVKYLILQHINPPMMKNLFKRRETKIPVQLDKKSTVSEHVVLQKKEELEPSLELQVQGDFLETDEDLGYC